MLWFGTCARLSCLVKVNNGIIFLVQEYKRKQLEEQRQSERLQRQLQQEHAYLVSLQQQQDKKPQLYHYNKNLDPNNKPTWAREVQLEPFPTSLRMHISLLELSLLFMNPFI